MLLPVSDDGMVGAFSSRMRRWIRNVLRGVEAATLAVLLSPMNEVIRVALVAAVLVSSDDALAAGIVWGGSTLVIELIAGCIAADLLATAAGGRWTRWFNEKAARIGLKPGARLSGVTKAGIAFLAGAGVAVFVEHREDPTRTRARNLRYGVLTSIALGAVCTVQGILVATGLVDPSPITLTGAVVGLLSVVAALKWATRNVHKASLGRVSTAQTRR